MELKLKNVFWKLKVIQIGFLLGPFLLILFAVYGLDKKSGSAPPDAANSPENYIAFGIALAASFGVFLLPRMLLGNSPEKAPLENMVSSYQLIKIMQWGTAEAAAIINMVIYILNGTRNALLAGIVLLLLITFLGPGFQNFCKLFKLSESQIQEAADRLQSNS